MAFPRSHPVFVQNDTAGTRQDTAVLLVGTAREFDISQQDIQSTQGGFWITEALADVLYAEAEQEAEPEAEPAPAAEPSTTKNASGNRAAKKTPKKGE